MSERIDNIKKAVEQSVGGLVKHVGSTPIRHMFRNQIAWEGVVETFDVSLHPTVKRCYGLMYCEGNEEKFASIPADDHINSPDMAVTAFVASRVER